MFQHLISQFFVNLHLLTLESLQHLAYLIGIVCFARSERSNTDQRYDKGQVRVIGYMSYELDDSPADACQPLTISSLVATRQS